jgi:hypothetical protein
MTSQDDPNRKAGFERFGRKLDEQFGDAAQRLEQEGDRVIRYLNDEVVPAIRGKSTKALRAAAEQLQKLAEYMDRQRSG